jgi:hypothetical protein
MTARNHQPSYYSTTRADVTIFPSRLNLDPSAIVHGNVLLYSFNIRNGSVELAPKTSIHSFYNCGLTLRRDCRHIQTAKDASFEDLSTTTIATRDAFSYAAGNARREAVSYLPIAPPNWCRIASDDPNIWQKPFRAGQNLPSLFILDQESRCNCGITVETAQLLPVIESDVTVFTSSTAIERRIQTMYCSSCRNTRGCIGPDLGVYGVFNWNNWLAFSHELFDSLTSQFTTSETPLYAYHQTVKNTYISEESPVPLCALRTFVLAYFTYIRLQRIATRMQCLQCGPNPPIVIADGIAVSFPKHRVESLRPPTLTDKSKALIRIPRNATRATCFIGSNKLRLAIAKALDERLTDENAGILEKILREEVVTHPMSHILVGS